MRLTFGRQFGFSLIVLIGAALTAPAIADFSLLDPAPLSFDERLECQRSIEQVYWQHRIWPAANPGPKPAIEEVLSGSVLRERVTTYLQKTAALEVFWHRPLTGEQLQAEMNRMVRDTRDPSRLRELFDALDHDPLLIAECLARPALVDRLTRNWYARDPRFHGTTRERAETALAAGARQGTPMPDLGGEYSVTEWRLTAENSDSVDLDTRDPDRSVIDLGFEEWHERVAQLAAMFRHDSWPEETGAESEFLEQIPLNRLSRLGETNDRFEVTAVLSKDADRVEVATVAWNKQSFGAWWREVGRAAVQSGGSNNRISPPPGGYELQSPLDSGCDADSWAALWYAPMARDAHTAVWTGTEMIVWGGIHPPFHLNTGGRYNPATDSWTTTSTGAGVPTPRREHTAVWTGTEMVVWGGYDGTWADSGGRYDPVTDSWTATSTGAGVPTGREFQTAVWTGTEMIVWGGRRFADGNLFYLNTGGRYDPAGDGWTATTEAGAPTKRLIHTAVWTGSKMIVWGGHSGTNRLNTGGQYDPNTDSWSATSVGTGAPIERVSHTAVWTGTEMIVWGGLGGSDDGWPLRTGARYHPSTNNWTATTTTGLGVPDARSRHVAVWTGNEMIVWGGGAEFNLYSGSRYDPSTDHWVATSTGAGIGGGSLTAVWTGTEMIVWGSSFSNRGGRYDPATDNWTPTTSWSDVPTARHNHTAVWTGTEMIVWGGNSGSGALKTGGRYDPAIDNWTPTSTGAGVPTARDLHTAVWTGTVMIVWGTYSNNYTGGRYDPVNDSWMPTSTGAGVAKALYRHTAVWTGTEMIIWGGDGFDPRYLNTGSRYDPATDSWTEMSTAPGVPAGRESHTAVWTGTEMVVWGGYDGDRLNTGGRYQAATDSWAETSMGVNVPGVRISHSAIWAGNEMIVWGGAGDGWQNTGGRYDPAADSWTPTSTGPGVPSERHSHTATWTGREMIVWGGGTSTTVRHNTGGLYDPALDSWTETSTATGVPAARTHHTAVWTGSEMIVWGGDPPMNSGGFYCACSGSLVSNWYLDTDGDGFGNGSTVVPSCVQPPGYIADGSDCDDTNPDTHPGAPEVNDGLDNQCPGDRTYGLVDEITGECGFQDPTDRDHYSWPAQAGAESYLVARSTDARFATDCLVTGTADTFLLDLDPVAEGTCHHYLVRTLAPHAGSWGMDSAGTERARVCP